jgi:hypothetical protein
MGLVLELATKSLVVADVHSPDPRFRLLDTTRAYALEKLDECGALGSLARRHATYLLGRLEAALPAEGNDGRGAAELDMANLRAALDWAFGPGGDLTIGIRLVAATLPVWFAASLLGDAQSWTEKAIRHLGDAGMLDSRQEMELQAALGISLQMARAVTSEAYAALSRSLALAEQLREDEFQLHVLQSLWIYHMRTGEVKMARDLARRAETIFASTTDPEVSATAEWMLGIALHSAVSTVPRACTLSTCCAGDRPDRETGKFAAPASISSIRRATFWPMFFGFRDFPSRLLRRSGRRWMRRGARSIPSPYAPRLPWELVHLPSVAEIWMRRGNVRRKSSDALRSTAFLTTCPMDWRRLTSYRCGRPVRTPVSGRSVPPSSTGALRNGMSS